MCLISQTGRSVSEFGRSRSASLSGQSLSSARPVGQPERSHVEQHSSLVFSKHHVQLQV